MSNSRKILLFVVFGGFMILINQFGIGGTPLIVKIIVLIMVPIYFIWLVVRFSKPSKATKYRIILYSAAGCMFYIEVICSLINRYYNEFFRNNIKIFNVIEIGGLFLTVTIMAFCYIKVKENEDQNLI